MGTDRADIGSIPSLSRRVHGRVYGTRCTVYVIRYTDRGRGGPEKASTRLARGPLRSLGSATLAVLATENIDGRRSCHREACAVFYSPPLESARWLPILPLTRPFSSPARGKREAYSYRLDGDNVAIVPT